jgi:hypothetical protein
MSIAWMLSSALVSGIVSVAFWFVTGSMHVSVPAGVGIGIGVARYLQERSNPTCETPGKIAMVKGLAAAVGTLVAVLIISWIESG